MTETLQVEESSKKTEEKHDCNFKTEKKQRAHDERHNPCIKESVKSVDCLNTHEDKRLCHMHVENYKACMKFWSKIRSQRRRAGVVPYLPPPEEREQIREDFFKQFMKT